MFQSTITPETVAVEQVLASLELDWWQYRQQVEELNLLDQLTELEYGSTNHDR